MDAANRDFLNALLAKQQELGIPSRQFAARLGTTPSNWSLVSRGKRRVSLHLAQLAVQAFPDLTTAGFFLLQPRSTVGNVYGANTPIEELAR